MATDYDEDEERRPVYFEQDPDSDDIGDGYFTYADGRREYGSSHEDATALEQQGKARFEPAAPEPAQPPPAADATVDAWNAGNPPEPMPEPEEEEAEPLDMAPEPAPMPEPVRPELPQL